MALDLQIDHREGRFVADTDRPGARLVLDFQERDEHTLDFKSTLVPPEFRGKGLGDEFVQKALEWARTHDYRVIPSCPFVEDVLQRHPEYEDVVAQKGAYESPGKGWGKLN